MRARFLVLIALVVVTPSAYAQDAAGMMSRAWTIEVNAAFLSEAWDYNLSREVLWGGGLAVRRRAGRSFAIGGEWVSFAVKQRGQDGWLNGGGPCVRWLTNPLARAQFFADLALGLSHADARVPPRGTTFNYLIHASGGLSRTFTPGTAMSISLTYVHLSNAGREGRDRNPDIQAAGLTVALSRSF
jgi:hypothetical protein